MNGRLLVIGAQPGSLGAALALEAGNDWGFQRVLTAGISGEVIEMDVLRSASIVQALAEAEPDVILCTVGLNVPAELSNPYLPSLMNTAFAVNTIGPIDVLRHFLRLRGEAMSAGRTHRVFVAISSNSAHVARRGSLPYCASKAALSMALRCAAREEAGREFLIWGYEPGLLAGTPMTNDSAQRFSGPLHRMPGAPAEGLSVRMVTARILSDVVGAFVGLNGCMFRLDAGEQ